MSAALRLLTTCAALCAAAVLPASAGAAGSASTQHSERLQTSTARAPHIFGGTPLTSSAQAPWAVLLQRAATTGFQTYCSANVITPTIVLTAAHCVTDEGVPGSKPTPIAPTSFRIQAGGTAENQAGTQVIGVAGIAVHPYYRNFALGDDVAVMALASPLTFNANVAPIAVAKAGSYVKDGKPLSFFGWGLTESQAPQGLRGMTTTARTSALCSPGIPGVQCAFNPTVAPCGGDSGGGLIRTTKAGTPELVGLDSFGAQQPEGQPQCAAGKPDGFADLTQPELNRFVGAVLAGKPSKPPVAPRAKRRPTVKQVSAFSTRLRCSSAGWSGKPKRTTVFAYESNRKVIQRGRSTTLTVTSKRRGKFIYCASYASNKGGRAAVESRNARRIG